MGEKLSFDITTAATLCTGADFWHSARVGDIPAITFSDGPYGLRKQNDKADHLGVNESIEAVCFPTAVCVASTFDTEAAEEMGRLLGEECLAEGVDVLLAPAVNIKRTPLCGRNFEYYSEDPYLAGELGAAFVRGLQSCGVGACVKHYAANNRENGRMAVSANMSERTLREIYLPAFIRVMKERPCAVMTSYNKVNGVYAGENKRLLDILREEYGFEGIFVSDWYAVADRVAAIKAGLDLEMPGGETAGKDKLIDAAQADDAIKRELLESARRVAKTAQKYGGHTKGAPYDKEKHRVFAASLAAEGAVLLKNDSLLPLEKGKKYLLVGEYCRKPRFQGGGSSHINCIQASDILAFLDEFDCDRPEWAQNLTDTALIEHSLKTQAEKYDAAVIFAALPDETESEGYDRDDLGLPKEYDATIAAVCTALPTAVVLFAGSPVAMPWLDTSRAVLNMHLGGEGVSLAAARLLSGKACPCGRLAESYPLMIEHTPSYLTDTNAKNADYAEGVFVGYRYYTKKRIPLLFPFGYGLSYTKFEYKDLKVENTGEGFDVSVKVKNVGKMRGKEVVQVYVSAPAKAAARPVRELKAFAKAELDPDEEKVVRVRLGKSAFAYYSDNGFITESGEHAISICKNAEDVLLSQKVFIRGDKPNITIADDTTLSELIDRPAVAEFVQARFGNYMSEGEGNGAIGTRMKKAMLLDAPLRAIKTAARMDAAAYEKFKALLQTLADK